MNATPTDGGSLRKTATGAGWVNGWRMATRLMA
jgi:hypothetical protein